MKVVLAGDPHSGKSVFITGLKEACKKFGSYPYVLTANPDGEGSWFQETSQNHPELAKQLKQEQKSKFTPEFVTRIEESVAKINLPLVLIDIGGRVTDENKRICRNATHIIILCPSEGEFSKWRKFADDLGLKILAEIVSDYSGIEDTVHASANFVRGTVHHLERGEDVSNRPMIQAVAGILTGHRALTPALKVAHTYLWESKLGSEELDVEQVSEYRYNDGLVPGGKRPRLYLAKGSQIQLFTGHSIPGYCLVVTEKYEKSGKWSNTDYLLRLNPGVRVIHMLSPTHGIWGEDFKSWGEVAQQMKLPMDVTKNIVKEEYPKTAERLDRIEEYGKSIGDSDDIEIVVITFGSPMNRQIREGYWNEPKQGETTTGQKVIIKPGSPGDYGGWRNPEIVSPSNAKVMGSKHEPGHHGGYFSVQVAVPIKGQSNA